MSKIVWSETDYVAISYDLKIVSADRSRVRAKDKAIAAGVTCPLVVPIRCLKEEFLKTNLDV